MQPRLFSAKSIRLLDAGLALWIAAWLVFATAAYRDLQRLSELSDAAVAAGNALTTTADALNVVSQIPFVGETIPELEQRVRRAARETVRAGRQSRDELEFYAVALAVALATGPTVPPLLLYLPLRRRWRRNRRAVAEALAAGRPDVRQYLARRALAYGDYATFSRSTVDGALRPEAVAELSERELRRLGLAAPAGPGGDESGRAARPL